MGARVPVLAVVLLIAAGCVPDVATPEPATPLPAVVDLDPRWTDPIAWEPIPAGGPRQRLDGDTHPGVVLVSDAMPLEVSFAVRKWELAETDWCPVTSERDQLVLPWKMGCVITLRIVVPDRVECAGAPEGPSANRLAAALLGHPTLGAIDLGPVDDSPILPPGLFAAPMVGRIVVVPGTGRPFNPATTNPDRCRLPLDSGSLELRGDTDAFLILLDVDDRLAVVHLATGGIDRVTGSASRDRGYASTVPGGDAELYRAVLGRIGAVALQSRHTLR